MVIEFVKIVPFHKSFTSNSLKEMLLQLVKTILPLVNQNMSFSLVCLIFQRLDWGNMRDPSVKLMESDKEKKPSEDRCS